jgi:hypothetical protein
MIVLNETIIDAGTILRLFCFHGHARILSQAMCCRNDRLREWFGNGFRDRWWLARASRSSAGDGADWR